MLDLFPAWDAGAVARPTKTKRTHAGSADDRPKHVPASPSPVAKPKPKPVADAHAGATHPRHALPAGVLRAVDGGLSRRTHSAAVQQLHDEAVRTRGARGWDPHEALVNGRNAHRTNLPGEMHEGISGD